MLPEVYQPDSPPLFHQLEALEAGWDKPGFGYFLDMGLGKSRVTIDNFCILYELGLVEGLIIIAPKSVYTNWTRMDPENPGELEKWLWKKYWNDLQSYTFKSGRAKKDADARAKAMDTNKPGMRILCINAEAIATTDDAWNLILQFCRAHRTMIVIDESTLIKNHQSQRTKLALKLAPFASYRRILSGSPSTGSPMDYFPQFEFLGPGKMLLGHRSPFTFRARYCLLREITVSGGRTIKMEVGTQNLDELAGLIAKNSIRRRKKDCLDLPEKQFYKREVPLTADQQSIYNDMKRTAMAEIRDVGEVTTTIAITQLMRMHQIVCGHVKMDDGRTLYIKNNRVSTMMEILENTDPEEQVVIWVAYRPDAYAVVTELRKVYGEDCVAEWHGGLSLDQREAGEADFKAGRKRFMVASKAGARGRTWTEGTLVIYYSNHYDLEIREQSEDRTHRIGTVGTVTYVDLVCPGTIDDKIIDALRNKKDVARAMLRDGIENWI